MGQPHTGGQMIVGMIKQTEQRFPCFNPKRRHSEGMGGQRCGVASGKCGDRIGPHLNINKLYILHI